MSTPKTSLPRILGQAADTAALTFSFLDTKDLIALSKTCQSYRNLFRETKSQKQKASELLSHIFNGFPKKTKEFLFNKCSSDVEIKSKSSVTTCVVLTKSFCKETYFRRGKKGTFTKRTWNDISPLEAAAWCGDIFILRELLAYIPSSQHKIAITQLQEMLDRKETAENGEFLAPYKALLKVYKEYINQYQALRESDKDEINKLWHQIGPCQRMLPTYCLQVFSNDKDDTGLLCFSKKPKRSRYVYFAPNSPIDLDSMLRGVALYKGGIGLGWSTVGQIPDIISTDSDAISHLCESRRIDLCNIIKELKLLCLPEDFNSIDDENSADKPGISL